MGNGVRHSVQRSNRVRLKADAVVLLDRIVATHADAMPDGLHRQVSEMRMRLAPPTGMKAPIIFTGYTK